MGNFYLPTPTMCRVLGIIGKYIKNIWFDIFVNLGCVWIWWFCWANGTYFPWPNMTGYVSPSYDMYGPFIVTPPSFVAPPNSEGTDLTFGNYTYQIPTSYPDVDSWSPDMMELITYNKENLAPADSNLFMHIVSEVDNTALYATDGVRRLTSLYKVADKFTKIRFDIAMLGFWRMDTTVAGSDDGSNTKLNARLVWDVKEHALMSKYRHQALNWNGRSMLRELKQALKWLAPEGANNIQGAIARDFAMFDETVSRKLPCSEDMKTCPTDIFPTENPISQFLHFYDYFKMKPHEGIHDTLIKFMSTRTAPADFLHRDYVSFQGYSRANALFAQYYDGDGNWGPLPIIDDVFAVGFHRSFSPLYCPYGSESPGIIANGADLIEFLRLALQVQMSDETSDTCKTKSGEKVQTRKHDFLVSDYEIMDRVRQINNPSKIYRSEVRDFYDQHGDEVYHWCALNALIWHPAGYHVQGYWYSMRLNFQTIHSCNYIEFMFFLSLAGMFCGNHRQGAELRINQIHD